MKNKDNKHFVFDHVYLLSNTFFPHFFETFNVYKRRLTWQHLLGVCHLAIKISEIKSLYTFIYDIFYIVINIYLLLVRYYWRETIFLWSKWGIFIMIEIKNNTIIPITGKAVFIWMWLSFFGYFWSYSFQLFCVFIHLRNW